MTSEILNELEGINLSVQQKTQLIKTIRKIINQEADNSHKVTYAELKTLRDNGKLVDGHLYRITDYVTTTKQTNTKSAGHPFDIIVIAVSENELSHHAKAIAHEGDTYFDGNELGAWELWYDLDNDTTKYEWADNTNGKGVIYRMIDEKSNDCPYDFKNILFYNDIYTNNTTSDKYYYTFSYVVKNVLYDGTVEKQVTMCHVNSMGVRYTRKNRSLNMNVWRNTSFGDRCRYNTFGTGCSSNTFGTDCFLNRFGDDCNLNTFGNAFLFNTFGTSCSGNTFGKYCSNNIFGTDCHYNTFGEYCTCNTLGIFCGYNTFGTDCCYNTFGNDCYYNTFGNYCNRNILSNGCSYNGFYDSSDFEYNEDIREYLGTGTPINNVINCRFGECSKNLLIQTFDGIKNLFVSQNLCSLTKDDNGYTLPEVIEVYSYGDYELKIARNRNGEIKVYCEADLV